MCFGKEKKWNTIKKLKGADGVEVEGEEGLKALVTNYFFSLFTPVAGINLDDVLGHIPPSVSPQMNNSLTTEFTAEEVKEALESIGDLKAPRSDGMPAVFYKKYWDKVSDIVSHQALEV